MFHTILVPLDGSELAERALPYAEVMARANGCRILLLRVVPASHVIVGDPMADQAKAVREAESYLADVAARLKTPQIIESAVFIGDPADSIVEEIDLRNVDLVVMSTHGRSGLGRWVYGSVADQVMRRAMVPVLLIPASCHAEWWSHRPSRVLVPLDGSDLATTALPVASNLVSWLGGELFLLRVIVPTSPVYADGIPQAEIDREAERDVARRYLEEIGARLRDRGQNVKLVDARGPAPAMIAATAAEQNVDLIAMSTHGRGGITRLLMGSVATGVVQQASVPVLIIPPGSTPGPHDEPVLTTKPDQATARR